MRTPLDILNDIHIPEPCPMDWDAMIGDGTSRHCSHCSKTVHDLSVRTAKDAARLVESSEHLCVRFRRADDGHVLTVDDLPRWRRLAFLAASWIGVAIAVGCDNKASRTLGKPMPASSAPLLTGEKCIAGGIGPPPVPKDAP